MNRLLFVIFVLLSGIDVAHASDVMVWQGQYYTDDKFNEGTYIFNFSIYDSLVGGDICFTSQEVITTGHFGQWRTEQNGINQACSDSTKTYYLDIIIDNESQTPRRKLTSWNYIRKDVNETTSAILKSKVVVAPVIRGESMVAAPVISGDLVTVSAINTSNLTAEDILTKTGNFAFFSSNRGNITNLFTDNLIIGNVTGDGGITITGGIIGTFHSLNGTKGINSTNLSLCSKMQGIACIEWGKLIIENGLVVGYEWWGWV